MDPWVPQFPKIVFLYHLQFDDDDNMRYKYFLSLNEIYSSPIEQNIPDNK